MLGTSAGSRSFARAALPVMLLLVLAGSASAQPEFIRGDCNGDLAFNISDPVSMLALLFSGGSAPCQSACDANDDGAVQLSDAVYALAAIFSGGATPPPPFPECGGDPTPDGLTCNIVACTPPPPGPNLREVDVAFLGVAQDGDGRLVSITGSGAQHQMTSWSLAAGNGQPSVMATTPPIDGHHPKIVRLSGLASLAGEPPFVTGTIRDDGNVWLSSRELTQAGSFVHHETLGYGANANVEVLSYDMAYRPIYSGFFLDEQQVVTAVVAEPIGGGNLELRIVSWSIDAQTGDLTGLADSGDLPLNFPNSLTPDEAAVSISHLSGIQYVLNFTSASGRLENHFFWVEDDGTIFYGGGAQGGQNIRGTAAHQVDQAASDVAAVTDSGYVSANRADDGTLAMSVWERRAEGFLNYEPYHLTDNGYDLGPAAKGVFIANPGLTDSWRYQASAGDLLGEVVAVGDFNGDGYDDALIAAPNRDINGDSDVGAVYVIHGDASNGITNKEYTQVWSQDTSGINGVPEAFDRFGHSLAVGDFDNDGNDDVAIGVPYEDVGATSNAGAVNVIYGSPFGLTTSDNFILTQEDFGFTSAANDYFAWSLASGDFDGDGYDDLGIGAYGREVGGHTNGGRVYVSFGSNSGLSDGGVSITQDTTGIWDEVEDFDEFGRALTAADFNGDGNDDLVIGVPRENIGGVVDAGAVHVLYGNGATANGFSANNFISQGGFSGGADIVGAVESGDQFGFALAAGDFDDDGAQDLAIGVPYEDVGATVNAGSVNILYGTFLGLTQIGNMLISQSDFNPGVGSLPGSDGANDSLGYALTTGDFDGDGYTDLMIGAPDKDLPAACSSSAVDDAGAIFEVFGGSDGLTAIGSRRHHQNACSGSCVMNGEAASGDEFGYAMAAGDFNADGEDDVLVGIPYKDRSSSSNTGAVQILPGGASGVDYCADEEWYVRISEPVRGRVSDLTYENLGEGDGSLFSEGSFLDPVHVASVTKCMTLLLAVEAIEDGDASLGDMVPVSELAGTTGGSFLELWDENGPVLDMNGDEIRFIETGDEMPLRLLLHAMMMRSCNRSSVAIGEHIAQQVEGNPDLFIDMMNDRAVALGMNDTVCGHPAGGMITTTQDLITMLNECWEHSLFRQISGIEVYGSSDPELCGFDIDGFEKCTDTFTKFQTIGNYPGRMGWKGGNGGLWWGSQPASGIPWCTSAAVAVVERAGRPLAMALQQTGDRTDDSQDLLDHGFRKLFTPDRCAEREFPQTGGIVGPEGPIRVRAFAVDAVDDNACVTAVIDDYEELRINVWNTNYATGDITPLSNASETYTLPDGPVYAEPPLIRMSRVPTGAASIGDYFTANLVGEHLELQIWRIGEAP